MMVSFSNIRDVRSLGEVPEAYLVMLDLAVGAGPPAAAEFCARVGGGGICDAVLEAIAEGQFSGSISPFVAPPAPLPHERALSRPQWLYGLERFGIYASIDAAIAAVADNVRRAALRSSVFGRETYHFADVIALLGANADILPAEIVALSEGDIIGMWATILTEAPS